MALVINGFSHVVPGRKGLSFRDDKRLSLSSRDDWRPRRRDEAILGIVVHTRWGAPVKIADGKAPDRKWDLDVAARWSRDERQASAHVAVDSDGSYACYADIGKIATFHASHVNGVTAGLEMYQDKDGTVYRETLEATADILDVLTRELGVQRQFCTETAICRRFANIVATDKRTYIQGANRGRDFCGVYGHRNVTRNRGAGDPGDEIFAVLRERGYEGFAVDQGEDVAAWADRQRQLGLVEADVDGVPEGKTRALIQHARHGGPGLWVWRPGDEHYDPGPAE